MTHQFTVQDMTCGHCAGRVTKALQALDPQARIAIDLVARKVTVDGGEAHGDYADAIRDAGYTPA